MFNEKDTVSLGAVELEKLPSKKDALKKLNLPVEVKSGFIGKLKIEIPFRHLKSQPCRGGAGGPIVLDSRTFRCTTCKCVCRSCMY